MRRNIICSLAVVALAAPALAQPPPKQQPKPQKNQRADTTKSAQATLDSIQSSLGFVPDFFRAVPSDMLDAFWSGLQFEGARTALDPKTKELIGLAVAAQIPCEYCEYYHREVARALGASDAEVREAVGMAAITRMGSTLLNGNDVDMAQFRKDVDRMVKGMRQHAQAAPAKRRSP